MQRHARLPELDVWISHLHADHCADRLTAFYALVYADQAPSAPLPLYGPQGTADRLKGFLSNAARSLIERAFEVRELHGGQRVRLGGMEPEPRVHHSPEDAGRTAARAGAGRSIVTHVGPFLRPEEALGRAASEYAGPVEHADAGRAFSVG